jgi:hypothetical protein
MSWLLRSKYSPANHKPPKPLQLNSAARTSSLSLCDSLRNGTALPALPELHEADDVSSSDPRIGSLPASELIRLSGLPRRGDGGCIGASAPLKRPGRPSAAPRPPRVLIIARDRLLKQRKPPTLKQSPGQGMAGACVRKAGRSWGAGGRPSALLTGGRLFGSRFRRGGVCGG